MTGEDDYLHGLEAEMAAEQRAAWEREAELQREQRERLREHSERVGGQAWEFDPPELVDAEEVGKAAEVFPAVDDDGVYDGG